MKEKFIYHHQHSGFSKELVESQLLSLDLKDSVHKVIVQNDHLETCTCVKVSMFDPRVFWAYRGTRKYPSPMITQEDAEDVGMVRSNKITVVVKKKGSLYRIITCYAGAGSPKEPSTATDYEYAECVEYWSNHALVPDERIERVKTLDEMPSWVINAYVEQAK